MRIISGKYKGRFLEAMSGRETRPTSDKVKESLFNIIGPYFEAQTVLDLYAGTGSLGLEAVSRGVEHGYFVDNSREAIQVIKNNIEITQEPEKFTVLDMSANVAIDRLALQGEPMNLVFIDPPYSLDVIEEHLQDMLDKDILSLRAIVVCETTKNKDLPEKVGTLKMFDQRDYGKTRLTFYQNTAPIE